MGVFPSQSERSDDLNTGDDPLQILADAQELLQRSNSDRLDADIATVLELLGQSFDADRAYLFQMKDMLFVQNTHEWLAPGATSVQADLQETPYYIGEMLWTAFRKHGVFLLQDVKAVPAGSEFHKMIVQQEIQSMFAAPLWSGNEVAGLIGLDYCKAARTFSARDSSILRSLAASIGLALQRRKIEKKCNYLSAEIQTANDKMSSMVLALPELLIETDQEGVVVGFYQRPSLIFALSPEEVIGLPPEAFLPAHVARIVRKAMAQVDADEWSQTFSYSIEIDGRRKRFALHATRRGKRYSARMKGYLEAGGQGLLVFLASLIGVVGVPGAAVAQKVVLHEMFGGMVETLAVPMAVWVLALLVGSQITSFLYPTGDTLGAMGLARSDDLRNMIIFGVVATIPVLIYVAIRVFLFAM